LCRYVTVSDFVSTLEKHLGVKAQRNYIPMPKTGDVPYTHADISKARAELHYGGALHVESS
jgi:UDP-glucuronate 4-epimerase